MANLELIYVILGTVVLLVFAKIALNALNVLLEGDDYDD